VLPTASLIELMKNTELSVNNLQLIA